MSSQARYWIIGLVIIIIILVGVILFKNNPTTDAEKRAELNKTLTEIRASIQAWENENLSGTATTSSISKEKREKLLDDLRNLEEELSQFQDDMQTR